MHISQSGLRFGDALLLSDQPAEAMGAVRWQRINPILSRSEYSRFMLSELHAHIETTHALCVQWDGYVVQPASWDASFLQFDYIGAPWPHFRDECRVGNGGFSLRSRRLLAACAELKLTGELEDIAICRTYRTQLEERFGLVFAPEEIASRFAWERAVPRGDEFGFHGAFNLVKHASEKESLRVLQALEAGILSNKEHRELLWWALAHGRLRLASAVGWRMRHHMARL
jgi:hypothetical protein